MPSLLKLTQWFLSRRWKCEMFTNRWRAWQTNDRQQAIRKPHLNFQLRWAKNLFFFVYHYPSLRKQLTGHCCNSLHSWQVNCLLASFVASFITGHSIWSSLIKYYIHNKYYWQIWQMKKKLQEVMANKWFDCLNVMFMLGSRFTRRLSHN